MVFSFRLHPHTRFPCSAAKSSSGTRRSIFTLPSAAAFSVTFPSMLFQLTPSRRTVQLPKKRFLFSMLRLTTALSPSSFARFTSPQSPFASPSVTVCGIPLTVTVSPSRILPEIPGHRIRTAVSCTSSHFLFFALYRISTLSLLYGLVASPFKNTCPSAGSPGSSVPAVGL